MNKFMTLKKRRVIVRAGLIISLLCISIYTINHITSTVSSNELLLNDHDIRITALQKEQEKMWDELGVIKGEDEIIYKQNVLFSNYGVWDTESSDVTASMLDSSDFNVNEYGMYTYQGRVVVATANIQRWDVPLKRGYAAYELGDYLTLELFDTSFPAVVLDVCGECHGNEREYIQRIDIFTTRNVVGLSEGKVYKNEY